MIGFITWPISEEPLNHDFPPHVVERGSPVLGHPRGTFFFRWEETSLPDCAAVGYFLGLHQG